MLGLENNSFSQITMHKVNIKSNQIKSNLLKAEGPSWSLTLP